MPWSKFEPLATCMIPLEYQPYKSRYNAFDIRGYDQAHALETENSMKMLLKDNHTMEG